MEFKIRNNQFGPIYLQAFHNCQLIDALTMIEIGVELVIYVNIKGLSRNCDSDDETFASFERKYAVLFLILLIKS